MPILEMPKLKRGTVGDDEVSERSQSHDAVIPNKKKRQATVYDAVAGRVSSTGFLPKEPRISKNRDTLSSTTVAVPPEEVLFRRRGAPVRYEENDIYWADRHLTEKQILPESDLLKAIHTYASDFYGRATKNRGAVDFESLDETALLSLGILLEEMAGHVLGATGDLAFVEGEEDELNGDQDLDEGDQLNERASEEISSAVRSEAKQEVLNESEEKRKRKRRKIKHGNDHVG